MALSMDEQRMLAEIEARLSAEEPGLAARLSSFRRPSPTAKLRSPRGRVVGSLFAVALAVVISLMVYAMIPFRATHAPTRGGSTPVASGNPAASAPVKPVAKPATSGAAKTASTSGSHHADASAATSSAATSPSGSAASASSGKAKTSTGKTDTSKTGSAQTGTAQTGTTATGNS